MRSRMMLWIGVAAVVVGIGGMLIQGPSNGSGFGWARHMSGYGVMGSSWSGSESAERIEGATEIPVRAVEFSFSPSDLVIGVGEPTNLMLVNDGAIPHDLAIPELDVRIVAGPGESASVGFVAEVPGSYEIVCTYPGHASSGMTGTLVVQES